MNYLKILCSCFALSFTLNSVTEAQQLRDKEYHTRGMLHETIYNTGEIGRAWFYGSGTDETSDPLMEWPGGSATIIDGIRYPGHHNSIGGGVHISANYAGANPFDTSARLYAFSGSAGQHIPTTVAGVYSFPMELERIENFPVLENGDLNPAYDPDEAEEIIISKWATNTGITVTRVSRAWSYPDYDDMIIYEYTFENTGDLNGDGIADTTATLYETMIGFAYGMGPSMLGYQRWYGTWEYDFMYRSDQRSFFDRHRWLNYTLNTGNGANSDLPEQRGAGKPDPDFFYEFAETGKNGGGLLSPQAPGFTTLYYDVNHLAVGVQESFAMHPNFIDSLESQVDPRGFLKQPFVNKVLSGNTRESKMEGHIGPFKRYSGTYTPTREAMYLPSDLGSTEDPNSDEWIGRGEFNFRQSWKAVGHYLVYGPYILEPGEKVEFSIAELVGYGATEDPNDVDEGGGLGEAIDEQQRWHYPPRWNDAVAILDAEGNVSEIVSENYLEEYGYPDYVNSDVRTVKDVADKAWEAYRGAPVSLPYWPEDNMPDGSYQIPVPPPAPALQDTVNEVAYTIIRWGRQVESFTHPRLTGAIDHYNFYRSESAIGPWTKIAEVPVGSAEFLNADGLYEVEDRETVVGESQFYAVTSVDANGNESGKSNLIEVETQLLAVRPPAEGELAEVHVVPNPFHLESGFSGTGGGNGFSTPANQIGFYGLPFQSTVRIYSYSGQLIETIEHQQDEYSAAWFQVSRNDQAIAPGIYFYVVEAPDGRVTRGKFVIIK